MLRSFKQEYGITISDLDFFDAAQRGDVQMVKNYLKQLPENIQERKKILGLLLSDCAHKGPESTSRERNIQDSTALMIAAKAGHFEIVRMLIEAGADVNYTNIKEVSVLDIAASSGHYEVVKLLIKSGAHLYYTRTESSEYSSMEIGGHKSIYIPGQGADARSVFFSAIKSGNLLILDEFIKQGVDINAVNYNHENGNKETPLTLAIRLGNLATVRFLLEKGASQTPLVITENFAMSEEYHGVTNTRKRIRTPLSDALKFKRFKIAELLLAYNPKVINEIGQKGKNLLVTLLEEGYFEGATFLVNHGADIHNLEIDGVSPLIYLIRENENPNDELIKAIFARNINVNLQDNQGDTALMYAVRQQNSQLVSFLLKHVANPDLPNRSGMTARRLASELYQDDSANIDKQQVVGVFKDCQISVNNLSAQPYEDKSPDSSAEEFKTSSDGEKIYPPNASSSHSAQLNSPAKKNVVQEPVHSEAESKSAENYIASNNVTELRKARLAYLDKLPKHKPAALETKTSEKIEPLQVRIADPEVKTSPAEENSVEPVLGSEVLSNLVANTTDLNSVPVIIRVQSPDAFFVTPADRSNIASSVTPPSLAVKNVDSSTTASPKKG